MVKVVNPGAFCTFFCFPQYYHPEGAFGESQGQLFYPDFLEAGCFVGISFATKKLCSQAAKGKQF
jgi:hypothetical protein